MKKKKVGKKVAAKRPAKKSVKRASVRATPRRSVKNRVVRKRPTSSPTPKPIGRVVHFYTHIKVAIVKFSKPVRVGDLIRMRGATTDFVQKVTSLQYDHRPIARALKGKQVGIKVAKRVREGDQVFTER